MRHLDRLRGVEKRHSVDTIDDYFQYLGSQYPLGLNQTWSGARDEEPTPGGFEQFAQSLFKASPVVFAAVQIRKALFSQARFQWLDESTRRMFGNEGLRLLERPWLGGTTAKLLARMLLHADLAGNAYPYRVSPSRLGLLRPDWCSLLLGSQSEPDDPASAEDAEFLGVIYRRNGTGRPQLFNPDEVGHFAPMPDPQSHFRGMSWLTPVIREIQTDKQSTEYKGQFFKNAATPNVALKFDPKYTLEQVKAFKDLFEEEHRGIGNAFKTMYIAGGAEPTVIGSRLEELEFTKLQGKAETRILMAAGVHAVVAGASEGMQGSSLNAGNYAQVRRLLSDVHLQDLWTEASASLEPLLKSPGQSSRLTVDQRYIPFLQDDLKDTAEVQKAQAAAARQLVDGGFVPETVIEALANNDLSLLAHSGKLSVQLQGDGEVGDQDE